MFKTDSLQLDIFFWLKMHEDCVNWCAACHKCQKSKTPQPKSNGLLIPIESLYPFHILNMDIKGPYKVSKNGFKYILVCVDHFTSWPEAIPIQKRMKEENTNYIMIKHTKTLNLTKRI